MSTIKDSNGEAIYDFLAGNNAQELYDRIQEHINHVRNEEGADYVILLTHVGMNVEQYTSNILLSKIQNVDAVLDGHTHQIYNTTSNDMDNKNIHITQTGTKLQSIGKLVIKKDGTIESENIQDIPEPSDTTNATKLTRGKKEVWVNKEMNDYINNMFSLYEKDLNELYGSNDYDLLIMPEGVTDSHSAYCRFQECTVGNLLTDAFRSAGNSNASFVNWGAVRNSLYKGNLTRSQIMSVAPFFNNLIVKMLPGQCILDALEFGVSKYPSASGGFPQVSGISYDIDTSINSTVQTDSQGVFTNVAGQRRVNNVKINGEDIDPNKNYSVAMSDFLGNGGDGYNMFAGYEVSQEGLYTDTDSIAYFIKNDLNGKIPSEYKDLQGRINFVNGSNPTSIPTTSPTSVPPSTSTSTPRNNSNIGTLIQRKKSGGLSTGGIIAIIIPALVVLIAAAVIAMICSSKNAQIQHISNSTTNSNIQLKV